LDAKGKWLIRGQLSNPQRRREWCRCAITHRNCSELDRGEVTFVKTGIRFFARQPAIDDRRRSRVRASLPQLQPSGRCTFSWMIQVEMRIRDSAIIDSAEKIAGPKPINRGQSAPTPNCSDNPAGEPIMPSVEGLFSSECLHGVYSGSPSRGNPSCDQGHANQEQNRCSKANRIARPQAIEH
jgi:hypothetical protein